MNILETCKNEGSYSLLIRTLGHVFSSAESLSKSFIKKDLDSPVEAMLDRASLNFNNLKKEDVRALEGDLDKDEDSQELKEEGDSGEKNHKITPIDDVSVDIPSLRRSYEALFAVPGNKFQSALINALILLTESVELDLKLFGGDKKDPDFLNVFVIVTEIPVLNAPDYLEMVLPQFCKATSHLPVQAQTRLARVWAKHCRSRMKNLLEALQQLITLKVISGQFNRDYCVNDEDSITAPTKVMKILYYANMLAGDLDPPDLRQDDSDCDGMDDTLLGAVGRESKEPRAKYEDPLGAELQVNVLDSRKPFLPFSEFYNEPLSDAIEMDRDFAYYKSELEQRKFSFMNHAFILTPATKTMGLYYDNRIRMYSERRMSFLQSVVRGQPTNPYLKLKVRRDHIIDDALVEVSYSITFTCGFILVLPKIDLYLLLLRNVSYSVSQLNLVR